MKNYLFTLFVRGFLAVSGFIVFIASAYLFGSEGRGVFSYGTSIFASIGVLLSLNLGRLFLNLSLEKKEQSNDLLPSFLLLSVAVSFLTLFCGIAFWLISDTANKLLTWQQALAFSALSFFYIWSHNGHLLFASLLKTPIQDRIILGVRLVLVLVVSVFALMKINNLDWFIISYSSVLFIGTAVEIIVLKRITPSKTSTLYNPTLIKKILKSFKWYHLDYVAFNIFPLLLMVFSAKYLTVADLGVSNFDLQLVNLIYLLSTTANLKVTSYVSSGGFTLYKKQLVKLLKYTLLLSILMAFAVYVFVKILTNFSAFSSFKGAENYFIIISFSIPGYCLYQLLNPIWIEIKKIKTSAIYNLLNLVFCLCISSLLLGKYGIMGFCFLFTLFFINLLFINLLMYFKNRDQIKFS